MNTITVTKGDTRTITATYTDSNGDAYDLSNHDVFLTIKANKNDADTDALIKKTYNSGSASGIATFSLTNADTDALGEGEYIYNIRLVNSGASTVLSTTNGIFEVLQGATRRISD